VVAAGGGYKRAFAENKEIDLYDGRCILNASPRLSSADLFSCGKPSETRNELPPIPTLADEPASVILLAAQPRSVTEQLAVPPPPLADLDARERSLLARRSRKLGWCVAGWTTSHSRIKSLRNFAQCQLTFPPPTLRRRTI